MTLNSNSNIDDCKEFANVAIDELLEKLPPHSMPKFPAYFRSFKNFESVNNGIKIGTVLSFYVGKCLEVNILQGVYGSALLDAMEDRKEEINNWYNNNL